MRSFTLRFFSSAGAATAAMVLLVGCETTSSSPLDATSYDKVSITESYPELQYREAMKQLRTGMTQAEVTTLISDPTRRVAAADDDAGIERWIYEIQHRPQFRTVSAEMEEIPVVDPITGEASTMLEARPETERFQLIEIFTLGFDADGILVDLDYASQRLRT
jgi:outer membrane protein assembly factor BamE (lipoprotein component of BamABCDE complex)